MIESFGFNEFHVPRPLRGLDLAPHRHRARLRRHPRGRPCAYAAVARPPGEPDRGTFIAVVQSIPVLMVLFLSYYGLASAGLELPPLLAASLSLGIYVGAYLAEIWRGAIEAVPHQQWEASESLAMSTAQQYRYVILPQALSISLPPTVGFLVQLVKNTSIVSVVGFVDLARAGQLINNATFDPFPVFGPVALIYFLICFPLSRLGRHFERVLHVGRSR
jgi:polar amino acid transport system permease protein